MSSVRFSAPPRFAGVSPSADYVAEVGRVEGELVGGIVASIVDEVPAFRAVPVQRLREVVSADIHRGQAAMLEGRLPTEEELEASAADTASLARAGVPMDSCIQARRLAMRRIFDSWRDRAQEAGVDSETQMAYVYAMWNWADAILIRSSAAHHEVEREVAGRDESRRGQFLRGLLDGTLSPAEAESRAAAYGLLPGGRYMALRARAAPGTDPKTLVRAIEATGGTDGRGALAAVLDGEIRGVVSTSPRIDGAGVLGLGSAMELAGLDDSFRFATRALETAMAFGLMGVAGIDRLSLRPAILSEDHLGERLVKRYLEPLQALGEFGQTLERTLAAYLANGMRVDDSAKALIVHPNTMRHRLDRFQQLTGADLHSTQDVLEIWWALERRKLG